jgi:methyltransferase family protein
MARTAKLIISVDHHHGSTEHQALAQGTPQYAPGLTDPQTGEHSTLRRFMVNLNAAGVNNVVAMVAPFEQVASHLRGCDIAFIDGQHDHAAVIRDAENAQDYALGRLGDGLIGPIIFHDYGTWAGVVSAVALLQRQWKARLEVIPGTTLAVLRHG